ncbi:MAG: thiamine-phosphate pyrophosphorylase [Candidatus Omnitrophica bacterium]|nr:thiamine-phosphate pyrophosphorylase [Candidatus Omnitrophota bacterium]
MLKSIGNKAFSRVIDANFNRAKEGFRVCEDVCRYVLDDAKATARWKRARHGLNDAVATFGLRDIVSARDIVGDVGRSTIAAESKRRDVADIFYANAQRIKESLRVLEEFSKLKDVQAAEALKCLRYEIYDLEKNALKSL